MSRRHNDFTDRLADQMALDGGIAIRHQGRITIQPAPVVRLALAKPKDTDNGQCWTEEIFSLL